MRKIQFPTSECRFNVIWLTTSLRVWPLFERAVIRSWKYLQYFRVYFIFELKLFCLMSNASQNLKNYFNFVNFLDSVQIKLWKISIFVRYNTSMVFFFSPPLKCFVYYCILDEMRKKIIDSFMIYKIRNQNSIYIHALKISNFPHLSIMNK